jgi:cyclophilin family peptidyl-prolyl cis-trans isomerase
MKTLIVIFCCAIFFTGAQLAAQKVKLAEGSDAAVSEVKMSELKSTLRATIETKYGKIEIAFFPKDAPKTVRNFVTLAKEKYFDGIIFHRVAKDFVIQAGDPTGTGSGGKSIYGPTFADEINPKAQIYKDGYKRGIVAMANRGPNTNSSQFFICLKDAGMPPSYTIFGKVIKGMEVVDKIGAVELTPKGARDGRPKDDIKMIKVTIK